MNSKLIFSFLSAVRENNNRPWFQQHKADYQHAMKEYESGISQAIARITEFDSSIAHITVKDATYRFYRDTRFSLDKSPYKRHLGAYISAHGKKSLHGGYYIHMEPGNCMLACGTYWLPTHILTACRNEIMVNIDRWRACVENDDFLRLFGAPNPQSNPFEEEQDGENKPRKGFGITHLKSVPTGFPRDYEYIQYLRMKDYCAWVNVDDLFFDDNSWLENMAKIFMTSKPMMDFVNAVVDDYE